MATLPLRGAPGDGAVRYAVTAGVYGSEVAFATELAILFLLMITILLVRNHQKLAPHTPYFIGSLYAVHRSLGKEKVWMAEYRSVEEARVSIALWIQVIADSKIALRTRLS